jgi:hypothetical protein
VSFAMADRAPAIFVVTLVKCAGRSQVAFRAQRDMALESVRYVGQRTKSAARRVAARVAATGRTAACRLPPIPYLLQRLAM